MGIQLRGKSKHRGAIVARQCGIDLGNHLRGRERIINVRVGGVQQRCHPSSEQDPGRGWSSRTTLEAQSLTQSPVIQAITIGHIKHAF